MKNNEVKNRIIYYLHQIEHSKDRVVEGDLETALSSMGFFEAPASTKYHGAYIGGLAEHSLNVAETLLELTNNNKLKWDCDVSPIIIGLFHDLCKCDKYSFNSNISKIGLNDIIYLDGHGDKSVMIASTLMRLTGEEMFCIRYHMGAYVDKSEWTMLGNAIKIYPNILWTHHADMIATYCLEE